MILIVDDEDSIREFIAMVLQGKGYKTIEARNGLEAMHLFEQNADSIELILTDIMMPFMGGLEFAKCVKALRPNARLCFMSSYSADEVFAKELDPNWGYLQKPFTLNGLLQTVASMAPVMEPVQTSAS